MIHATYGQDGTITTIGVGGMQYTEAGLLNLIDAAGREQTATAAYARQQESYRELDILYQAERDRSQQERARADEWAVRAQDTLVELHACEGRLMAAEADAARWRELLTNRMYCENCGGRGIVWTDIDGKAEADPCDCWVAADQALAAAAEARPV